MQHCTVRQRRDEAVDGENDGAVDQVDDIVDDDDLANVDMEEPEVVDIDANHEVSSFLLGLREEHKSTRKACSFVADGVADIVELCREEISRKVMDVLHRSGANMQDLKQLGLTDALGQTTFENSLNHFSAGANIDEYAAEHFHYIQPVEFVLGYDNKGKPNTMQYVPITDTLKALLSKDDVFAEVFNGHKSQDGIIADFCDGSNFENHELFSRNHMTLQIQFYYDDFNVANPLGTKVNSMKFGAFYYILGNIPPKNRSKLQVMQLVTLCMSKHIKSYGMSQIMRPFMHDMVDLETHGFTFVKEGIEYQFQATISFVSADNLAAHDIGGFQTHFNHGRICRACNVTSATMKNHFNSRSLDVRTKEAYNEQVEHLLQNPNLSSVYGIKHDSPLHQLQYFHVANGLPADLAHDLFEGAVPEVIRLTVLHCVNEGYFSLLYLNDQIDTFPYGEHDKTNKPSRMSTEVAQFRVKQTASQSWCLLRLLPLMVGHAVPLDDQKWPVLLQLLDVVEVCVAPRVNKVIAESLSFLIENFLSLYYNEYPDISMKPKCHYLTHYPRLLLEYGPLVHCWTLRFEAKHFLFKELSWRTKNRRNILKSLAERHEYHQAWHRSRKENFLSQDVIKHTNGHLQPVNTLPVEVQNLILPHIGASECIYVASKVESGGTCYSSGSAVVLQKACDALEIGIIDMCLILSGIVYLVNKCVWTNDYIPHVHAYNVSDNQYEAKLLKVSDLVDYYPLDMYETEVSKLVVLKHHIL